MQINAYLFFNGQCREAFQFYAGVLSGQITSMFSYGSSPMADQNNPSLNEKIMHARLEIAGQAIMGSDAPPERFQPQRGFSMSVGVATPADAERIFKALSVGGTVEMPVQKTFWSSAFAMFTDRFGISWMINCELPA
jgi:PhnB protein